MASSTSIDPPPQQVSVRKLLSTTFPCIFNYTPVMSTPLQGTGMLLRSQKSHPQNNSIKRWDWREVGSALLIGTIALLKEVHKRPLIFLSCKRGEEGEEEEERGVPVCECEYMHTLAKVHVCKRKTTLDVNLGFYLA